MDKESVLKLIECDDEYDFYQPLKPIKIFGCELDHSDCSIAISKNLNWEEIAFILTDYLKWLSSCKTEITTYFHLKLGQDLKEDWFESLEVYGASITFISLEDFGATVEFGESILSDHIVVFDFEKFSKIADRLQG